MYIVHTVANATLSSVTGGIILSSQLISTQGATNALGCYLVKATGTSMTIQASQYYMGITPYLGEKLTSLSWTAKTGSSSYTVNVEKGGIYEYFTNSEATFTNATILSSINIYSYKAYLVQANNTTMTIENTGGSVYGGALSEKIQ